MDKPIINLLILLLLLNPLSGSAEQFKATGNIEVYFSPRGASTEAIVREINTAKSEILVQASSFTSKPITKALVEAKKRGVKIEPILDKNHGKDKNTTADIISNIGIPADKDVYHAIEHNKIIIIDRQILITGSFDFTKDEEYNAGNMLIIKSNKLYFDKYIDYLEKYKGHFINI